MDGRENGRKEREQLEDMMIEEEEEEEERV